MVPLMRNQLTLASVYHNNKVNEQPAYHIVDPLTLAADRLEQLFVIFTFFETLFRKGKNEPSLIYNRLELLICYPANVKQNRQISPAQKF